MIRNVASAFNKVLSVLHLLQGKMHFPFGHLDVVVARFLQLMSPAPLKTGIITWLPLPISTVAPLARAAQARTVAIATQLPMLLRVIIATLAMKSFTFLTVLIVIAATPGAARAVMAAARPGACPSARRLKARPNEKGELGHLHRHKAIEASKYLFQGFLVVCLKTTHAWR